MRRIIYLLFLSILFACTEEETPSAQIDGNYTGVFIRTHPQAKFAPANVTLQLQGGRFSGTSARQNYPAICEGSYTSFEDKILFEESCIWTADFDWSYILSGSFDYTITNEEITFTRKTGDFTDHYYLKKE